MAFQPGDKIVQFADLKSTLSQSKAIDPALYQTVQTLIERLDKFKSSHDSTVDTINNNVNKIVQNIVITPNIVATYLTLLNEVGQLPQSVQLLAGTNITFDDSVANRRIVNATSGGADLDYLGNYAPATYNDGDIVIGSDGVAYMCVKDGTTTPPEAWPGSSGGSGGSSGPHAPTHEIGGTDIIDIKLLGGYPSDVTKFLNGTGVFSVPSGGSGGTPSPHHLTHEPGGSDPMAVDAIITIGSLRTLGTGPQQAAPGNDTRFTNARPPIVHATTHQIGGSDIVDVKLLGGYPGGTTTFLRADGTFNTPTAGVPGAHHITHELGGTDVIQNNAWLNQANVFTQYQTIDTNTPRLIFNDPANPVDNRKWTFIGIPSNMFQIGSTTDAGLTTANLQLDRNGNVLVGNVLTANNGLGSTPLNASNLTIGTVPDARLSSNVALRNVTNTFTASQFISTGTSSELRLITTSANVDARTWRIVSIGYNLYFQAVNDANTVQQGVIDIDRTGVLYAAAGLGTTPLNASNLTSGTVPDVRLSSNVALKNIDNNFIAQHLGTNTTIVGTNSILYFQAYSATLNNKIWRIINYSDGRLIFEALSDDLSVRQSYTLQLDRVGNALIQGDIYEKTRTTPIGHWISFTPTFAVDTGTITLNTAYTAKYTLIGKTIILSIRASITLSIAVPAYFMFTPVIGASYTTTPINDNIDTIGVVQSLPGEGRIVIYHNLSATINWTAGAHEIGFTISYEFQ